MSIVLAVTSALVLLLPASFALLAALTGRDVLSRLGPNITLEDVYPGDKSKQQSRRPRGRETIVLAGGAFAQLAVLFLGGWTAWLTAACWMYVGMYALIRRQSTVPYSIAAFVSIDLARLVWAVVLFALDLTGTGHAGSPPIAVYLCSIGVDLVQLSTCLSMPLAELPAAYTDAQKESLARGEMGLYRPRELPERSSDEFADSSFLFPLLVRLQP